MIDSGRKAATVAIRDARKRAGLTQEQAAARMGHATSTISRWETGGLPQNWEQLIAYAYALDQSIVLAFGPDAQKDAPPWAEAVAGLVADAVVERLNLDAAEIAAAALKLLELEADDVSDEADAPASARS